MDLYKIQWKRSAEKELKKLDKQIILRILQAVESLAKDPWQQSASKKLVGSDSIYRIRVGDYRIIYSLESTILTIEIIRVGHRKEVYRKR
jgi:mRNA interferase RelE/StbE